MKKLKKDKPQSPKGEVISTAGQTQSMKSLGKRKGKASTQGDAIERI